MKQLTKKFFSDFYFQEKSRLILWIPVFLFYGNVFYFELASEPKSYAICGALALSLLGLIFKKGRPFFIGFLCFVLGVTLAFVKTQYLDVPLLNEKMKDVTIQGHIEAIDYNSEKKRHRVTILLDQPNSIKKVRINSKRMDLEIGDWILGSATLLPYGDPVSQYSYDFRRQAYFLGIGASGTLHKIHKHTKSHSTSLDQSRLNINNHLRSKLKGQEAEIAIALITGFRGAITQEINDAFANSGLVHILSISGLHISLVAWLVFLILRRLIALIPSITERYNTKKLACLLSIPATFFYVALSGFQYPAIRAFYMTSFSFLAIILDRDPFNMRNVALAAFLILLILPESAISVSFQLSFAAVLGLIAFYETCWPLLRESNKGLFSNKIFAYIAGIVITTIIATLSTTPFSLYYFKKLTLNAVFSNMMAIPLTGFVIMPCAMICILSYFTIDINWPYTVLMYGIKGLIWCAKTVASWQGSQILITQPKGIYLALFSFGFLWVCLFITKIRFFGFVFIGLAFLTLLDKSHLPDIYATDQVIGYKKNHKFYISSERGSFFHDQWKSEQGYKTSIIEHQNQIILGDKISLIFRPWEIYYSCSPITISNGYINGCDIIIDRNDLKKKGTHLIWLNPFKVKTVRETLGKRPWVIKY